MLNHCRAHVNVTLMQTSSTLDGQVYQWKPENWGKLAMTQICVYLMLRGESIVLLCMPLFIEKHVSVLGEQR